MTSILQGMIGGLLGIAGIGAVFWWTFRSPPSRRPPDGATEFVTNEIQGADFTSMHSSGHGGQF